MTINEPDSQIAEKLVDWTKNRDFISGTRAVKAKGEKYLPKESEDQSDWAYRAYKQRVTFYAAAERTLQGYMGLIFRHQPVLQASETMDLLCQAITPDGKTLEQLSSEIVSETFQTNYSGLFIDHPPVRPGLSAANAVAQGYRPFINHYRAETILGVEVGVIRNRKVLTRVRLLEEGGDRVRELLLRDGVYEVIVHNRSSSGQWVAEAPIRPLSRGKPLDHIPFVVVSTQNTHLPTKGLLDETIELNHQHYLNQGFLASTHYYTAAPIPVVIGAEAPEGGWQISPGQCITIPERADGVEFGYWEFKGEGVESIERERAHLEDLLARQGARVIASEKTAVEAAETHSIRRASENAVLAQVARSVSLHITKALEMVARWIGDTEEVSFALNTDYLPDKMDSQAITALVKAWQAGAFSHETLFLALRDGEVFNETLTFEEEQERMKREKALTEGMGGRQASPIAQNPTDPLQDSSED